MILNALTFPGMPAISGVDPCVLCYDKDIWPNKDAPTPPDAALVAAFAKQARGAPIILDFESFPLYPEWNPPIGTKPVNVSMVLNVIKRMRVAAPEISIGWFGLPFWSGAATLKPLETTARRWRSKHDGLQKLLAAVDFVSPSLYLKNNDDDVIEWEAKALGVLKEARRLTDKPILPFISPAAIDGTETYLTTELFSRQLDLCLSHSDGPVLWNNWHNTELWDESLPFIAPLRKVT